MPSVNPYKPGDDIFQQYDLTRTMPVKSAINIVKGKVYAIDADGYVGTGYGATGGVAQVAKGWFQAKVNSTAVSGESDGDRKIQFLLPGAFMIFKAPANIVEGERVELEAQASSDKIKAATGLTQGSCGRVYQILTVDSNEERKRKTAANDVVIVNTGVV